MSDALAFDLMSNLPTMVYMYFLATVLPMRNMGGFVVVEGTASLLASSLRQGIAPVGSPLNAVLSMSGLFIIPLLFFDRRTPLARRLAACVVGMLVTIIGEVGSGLVVVLSGYEYLNYEQIASASMTYQLGIHALDMAFMLAACGPIKALFALWMRDILHADGTYIDSSERAIATPSGNDELVRSTQRQASLLATMPVAQGIFIWVLAVLLGTAENQADQAGFLAGICLMSVLSLATDAVLFKTVRRYERARENQARTAVLETHLHEQMASYEQLARQVEATARMRHDLRNHLQVLTSLVNLGQTQRAKEYAGTMIAGLESVETEEGKR